MTDHAVVIAGAGPTGMMLAAELTLAGVDCVIVERNAGAEREGGLRALGLHARTLEVLDMRGIVERFLSQGQTMQTLRFHNAVLDLSDFPSRRPYGLALAQLHTERILAAWIEELGVRTLYGRELTSFVQDDAGVTITFADGSTMRAQYLVGCDGGRSVVRKTAGIEFPGWDASISWMIAEIDTTETPAWGFRENADGIHAIGKADNGRPRLVIAEPTPKFGAPTLSELSDAMKGVWGTDFGAHSPSWLSRFNDATRQAATYRDRRVILAGDAAHIHAPLGGQGLNLGIQDAVNLGWKLAQVIRRVSPDSLLDTYHVERHPVAARAMKNTMAHVAVRRLDARSRALGDVMTEILTMNEPRRQLAAEMSGLGIHYDLGAGHPLLGRRMPDLDLVTAQGPTRVFTLLHRARPVLLNFGAAKSIDIARWGDRVQSVDAQYEGEWALPAIGTIPAPAAVLVRPDGHVAWVGDGTSAGLVEALSRWFGVPSE